MDGAKVARARDALEVVYAISNLLNAKLDRSTLSILIALCDHGVNPEALAVVVKEMRLEAQAVEIFNESRIWLQSGVLQASMIERPLDHAWPIQFTRVQHCT
ncbi:hypothetical protein R1flu_015397 [Riccia fluitans]|uniref:Mitotic-spindle organizing protein 1 n=1 Tax=Riccia fluitans TaxID=41844 RepID=A0ABD1YJA8_9MARC